MSSIIKVNTVEERDAGNGVTIDGVLIKDSKLASGIGNVLQVVTATTVTDTGVLATTSFQDTGLSGSITPSATSSKVLVVVNQTLQCKRDGDSDQQGHINIMRGSSQIYEAFYAVDEVSGEFGPTVKTIIFLDSPSTTSATTYKTQIKGNTTSNGGSVRANQQVSGSNESFSSIHLVEIGA